MKLEKPKNRKAEVLNLFITNDWVNYYYAARELNNINVHRIRDVLEHKHGIKFKSRFKPYINRFGRPSRIKEFQLVTPNKKAVEIYYKINIGKK
jgi:hypothetical protein